LQEWWWACYPKHVFYFTLPSTNKNTTTNWLQNSAARRRLLQLNLIKMKN
jgi:hypothetical protein